MIKSHRPQRGDVVITRAVDGFWTHRPLDGSHTPSRVDTLEAAVASGGLMAARAHVDLWLWEANRQFQVLVNCRRVHEPDRGLFTASLPVASWRSDALEE